MNHQDWSSFYQTKSFFYTPEATPLYGTNRLHFPFRRLFGATRVDSREPFNQLILRIALNDPSKLFALAFSDPPSKISRVPEGGLEVTLSDVLGLVSAAALPQSEAAALLNRLEDLRISFQAFVPDHYANRSKRLPRSFPSHPPVPSTSTSSSSPISSPISSASSSPPPISSPSPSSSSPSSSSSPPSPAAAPSPSTSPSSSAASYHPTSPTFSRERDLGLFHYSASFKHLSSLPPISASGFVSLSSHRVTAAPLRLDQSLPFRRSSLTAHFSLDLAALRLPAVLLPRSRSPLPPLRLRPSAGLCLSHPVFSSAARLSLALEAGYQPETDTLDLLDPHTSSERKIHMLLSNCRLFTASLSSAESLSDPSQPGWSLLLSLRNASHLNSASLAALFQYYPSPYTKADCGALLSYIDNSEYGPQTVLTAASRWRFNHPNAGMESHLSLKLSTGLDGGPMGVLVTGVTLPELRIGKASLSFVCMMQRSTHWNFRNAFRVELDSIFTN